MTDGARVLRLHAARATPLVYLIATRGALTADAFLARVVAALEGGAAMVQLRDKGSDREARRELGHALRRLTRDRGVPLIVNDDPELAVAVDADGVHVGQDDVPVEAARAVVGPERWVGLSTHDVAQIDDALRRGVDLIGVGPVFRTTTKDAGPPVGIDVVAAAMRRAPALPVFPIGGITAEGCRLLASRGCRRVAVSSAVLAAPDPAAAVRDLLSALASR